MSSPRSRSRSGCSAIERLELADDLVVAAEPELGLDPVLERGEPAAPRAARSRPARTTRSASRRAPARARARAPRAAARRPRRTRGGRARLPLPRRAARSARRRARRARPEGGSRAALGRQAVGDDLAQLRHVDLERVRRGRRRLLAPEVLDQPIGGDELVPVQEKQREQRTRLTAFYRERRAIRPTSSGPRMRYSIGFSPPPTDRNAQVSGFFQGLVGAS